MTEAGPRVDRPYIADGYGIPEHLDGVLPWSWAAERLTDALVYWVASVLPSGRPHVTPLVAVWLDGAVYFATGSLEQKAVNLRVNRNVILTTGCNEWE